MPEFKRIGQVSIDSGAVYIIDPSYIDARTLEGRASCDDAGTFAKIEVKSDGIYPVLEFEHEGTRYVAFPAGPAKAGAGSWDQWADFAADRQQDARDQGHE